MWRCPRVGVRARMSSQWRRWQERLGLRLDPRRITAAPLSPFASEQVLFRALSTKSTRPQLHWPLSLQAWASRRSRRPDWAFGRVRSMCMPLLSPCTARSCSRPAPGSSADHPSPPSSTLLQKSGSDGIDLPQAAPEYGLAEAPRHRMTRCASPTAPMKRLRSMIAWITLWKWRALPCLACQVSSSCAVSGFAGVMRRVW